MRKLEKAPEQMMAVENKIKEINVKLQQLIKKYAVLQKENVTLSGELRQHRDREKSERQKIDLLEMQTAILKTSAGNMSPHDKSEFEKKINQYIKDLEKCMTMLNK